MARANNVWGQAPDVELTDVTFPPCPPGAPGLPDTCVKVDAFRNQARGNPLPMFFGNLVGVTAQGVRATATAQIVTGNTTDCLKPWAILDRWNEFGAEGPLHARRRSTYDKYSDGKGQAPPQENDVYIPPSAASDRAPGSRCPPIEGRRFAVKTEGDRHLLRLVPGDPASARRWPLDRRQRLPATTSRPAAVCRTRSPTPGIACPADIGQDDAAYWATQGCFGVKTGGHGRPDAAGHRVSHRQDPGATYGDGTRHRRQHVQPADQEPARGRRSA